ncbi:hypothetical protein D3C87_119020 [compost metagenome]
MCFLWKRTAKNIDRIENESDELKNLFDEKMERVAISVRGVLDAVRIVCQIIISIERRSIVCCWKNRRNSI